MTRTLARQMSGPVPSPSMNGMMGMSGTRRRPFSREIFSPLSGTRASLYSMRLASLPRFILPPSNPRAPWVREDVHDLAGAEALLHVPPEPRRQEIRVAVEKALPQLAAQAQEADELLWKKVVGAHVVPGLGVELLLRPA